MNSSMKQMIITLFLGLGIVSFGFNAEAQNRRTHTDNEEQIRLGMQHLRAQINALDAQRELMQVNHEYLEVLGTTLNKTADDLLMRIGIGIPEHLQGLSTVRRLGEEIAALSSKRDMTVFEKANAVRSQCMNCHANEHPPGGVDWGQIFKYDWTTISANCNKEGRNPYLCRSMNAMMSAYGYLITAQAASSHNYEMTKMVANELVRVLIDLKEKNFSHLNPRLRQKAEDDARELARLAAAYNPEAFQRIPTVTSACTQCHRQNEVRAYYRPNTRFEELNTWSVVTH